MTRVAIVILNWNGADDTLLCVDSLLKQSYKNYDIIVIDNGSKKSDYNKLKSGFKNLNVTLLRNEANLGFAGGVNTGINYAINNSYDAVALCNNDAIFDKNWLKNLERHLSDETSIVTGLLLRENGSSIDSCGEAFSIWGTSFPLNRNEATKKQPKSGYRFGATGGASLYNINLFKEIGLFDETFFAYYEDADISFRAQLAGHKVYYTKDAVAYHKQGATSSKVPGFTVYQTFKNLPLLFWKNIPTTLLPKIGLRFLLLYTLIFLNAFKNKSGWPATKGLFASIYYFWTSAIWKRIKIQSNKKVSAKHIWSILYHDLPPEQTGMRKFRGLFVKVK